MSSLEGKRALVTGGCGFIGVHLVGELVSRGAQVSVFDRPHADWSRLPEGVRPVRGDLLDASTLDGACDGVDLVLHLAARTDIDGTTLADYGVNTDGTANVLDAAESSGSVERFVFYSTQLVAGLFDETRFIDESEPYKTKTVYGRSKIEGEKLVMDRGARTGVPYTIIRPTSVYGPWGEEPYKEFFRAIRDRRYFHVGKADNLVSWVYVKNLVDLTLLAATSDEGRDEVFFGNDLHPYTMREIVDTVGRYYGRTVRTVPAALMTAAAYVLAPAKRAGLNAPIYPFRLRNIRANYCYDVSKSVRIGYRPRYDLEDGVRETLDWYESRSFA